MNGNKRPIKFAPVKQKRIKVVCGETRFGGLLVESVTESGEMECVCVCGTRVVRGPNTITIRKFQMCDECRKEYVEEVLERKESDKRRNVRRLNSANNQSADQA